MSVNEDMEIKVFLVDDHPVVLEGLHSGLGEYPGINIVGTARSPAEARGAITNGGFDLLLMDLNLPDVEDGLALIRFAIGTCPQSKVVVLTYSDSPDHVFEANQAGAHAYLVKDVDLDDIADALSVVMSGGRPSLKPELEAALWRKLREVPAAEIPYGLSQREWQILRLMTAGVTNEDIAEKIFLSHRVVRRCNTVIFQKLGIHNRGEAITLALREKLFFPPEQ